MTNPGDSDEWWKQYGGESSVPQTPPAAPQPQPSPPPAGYTSAPQYQNPPLTPPPQPVYPNYPQPQANPTAGYPPAGQVQGGGAQPPGYGYPGYQPYGYSLPTQQTNSLAIASLIVSIVGLPGMFMCLFIPLISIVGLVLGIVSLNQIKSNPQQQGRGLALGGIWVGAAGVVIGLGLLVLLIALGDWSTSYS
ncbi:DUF4190 domain-containing protein [Nocardia sp. CDC160]|uniref:DUF4190 domain-containing protein n=1 Tax=Nocardia sp. CDC160 TaxID=3112166 RepID=UPI002DB5F1D2|nr:DUF4190 domain-containing protein [Nocardia sp. CDC160]MEC3913963.1 DUF4190 domain-containing protein [Nocardia sp. CDC160]